MTGIFKIKPASYDSALGKFVTDDLLHEYDKPDGIYINYYAGLTDVPDLLEDAVVRLAHARMPESPCGCSIMARAWKRDTKVPETIAYNRYKSAFGLEDGAWAAWQIAQEMKLRRTVFY